MSKQRNDNIGHITCLIEGCTTQAAVRKNRSGKYYFDCPDHGRITPNLPEGQAEIMEKASIWGAGGPPSCCARWIAEQWSWGRVMRDPEARHPVNGENPIHEDAPVTEAGPVHEEVTAGPGVPPPPPEPAPAPAETPPMHAPETETEPDNEPAEEDFA